MFTALGSPKGALFGLSAAALIIAITYSLYAATPARLDTAVEMAPAPVLTAALADPPDDLITGAVSGKAEAQPNAMPGPLASRPFLDALALLKDKKYAGAYAAARGFASDVERRTIQWAAITYGNGIWLNISPVGNVEL